MSSDKAGQKQDDRGDPGAPAAEKRPEPPDAWFQAFVDEYRRNNAASERREQTKDVWARAIAVGGVVTTALTGALAVIGWWQFSLAQNQAQVQLRPYAAVTLDETTPIAQGQKVMVRLHYDSVGNTPVYAATFHPFFEIHHRQQAPYQQGRTMQRDVRSRFRFRQEARLDDALGFRSQQVAH